MLNKEDVCVVHMVGLVAGLVLVLVMCSTECVVLFVVCRLCSAVLGLIQLFH